MNPAQQEMFDRAILNVLDAKRTRFGLTLEEIRFGLPAHGFPVQEADAVIYRLDYLELKGHVAEVVKETHRANRAWRITDMGITWLDERS